MDAHPLNHARKQSPLAYRMRPTALKDFVGQTEVVGAGTPLRQAIENDKLHSMILYGPAGVGKTSLASVIADTSKATFVQVSAVSAGVKVVREIIQQAGERLVNGDRTVLFIDEIHRFNKAQQDALLPAVEDGIITLVGATTENPFFEVNSPLISRSQIYILKPLLEGEIRQILQNAVKDGQRGLGGSRLRIEPDVLDLLARSAGGDGRRALNALEFCAELALETKEPITIALAREVLGARVLTYDKGGDVHYDVVSAFIKSLRGSDPDAAVYWLARMIEAGEDPKFIARRMVIFASEDVGNADPQALLVATATAQAVQLVGLPECRLNLAQGAIYLAVAAKSNSTIQAIDRATADLRSGLVDAVPQHLKDSHYAGAKKLGHGVGYKYPHNFPGRWVGQQYLPDSLVHRVYYRPSNSGLEKKIAEHLLKLKNRPERLKAGRRPDQDRPVQ